MFWQYFEYALDSEYVTALNMSYTGLWMKFPIIDVWQDSEYASSSKHTSVTQGSIENSAPYMFDRFLSISWALNMLELEYTRVVNIPRLHTVLCKLYFKDSQYFECLEFWIC